MLSKLGANFTRSYIARAGDTAVSTVFPGLPIRHTAPLNFDHTLCKEEKTDNVGCSPDLNKEEWS